MVSVYNNKNHPYHRSTRVEFIQSDITNQDHVKNLISNIFEKYGQIHMLVNLVEGYIGGKSIIDLEESECDKMMDINLKSAFLISKYDPQND